MVSFILPGNSASGGYEVDNSCIFDRASTDSMSKSMSDGSSIKGTFSAWIKVDGTGNEMNILSHFQDTSNVFTINTSGSGVAVVDYNSGYSLQLQTNRLMRDPSAWFHLYIAIDRSQGTADLRNRMFINGVEQTSFKHRTNYSQQTSGSHQDAISMNDGQCTMYLGGLGDGNQMFGGYLAELHWIDGTVPAVTEFGEFDEDSGIWKPKLVSDISYGTNGFYLDFQDASNLGNDANGGTDLTESNIASTNQSTDTCTNNFATLNPLDNSYAATTFSEGNLKAVTSSGNESYNTATIGVASGKWYWEVKIVNSSTNGTYGITDSVTRATNNYLGDDTYDTAYLKDGKVYRDSGYVSGFSNANTLTAYDTGDILMFALDLTNNALYAGHNGTWGNSSNPTSGASKTGAIPIDAVTSTGTGFYFPAFGEWTGGASATYSVNFGSPEFAISSGNADANGYGNFEYAVPSGYYSLNTKNLAEYG
jgi:hypothetical protein